jgi:hypothetical protein
MFGYCGVAPPCLAYPTDRGFIYAVIYRTRVKFWSGYLGTAHPVARAQWKNEQDRNREPTSLKGNKGSDDTFNPLFDFGVDGTDPDVMRAHPDL